jgi:hypothetical protein
VTLTCAALAAGAALLLVLPGYGGDRAAAAA